MHLYKINVLLALFMDELPHKDLKVSYSIILIMAYPHFFYIAFLRKTTIY